MLSTARFWTRVALFVAGIAAPLHAAVAQSRVKPVPAERVCRIRSITDGDSFACADGRRIRLLLIDAPEMRQGRYGRIARNYLISLMPVSSTVSLTFDVRRRDQYGRYLAYAQRGKIDINRQMVRSGMALVLVYPPNVARVELMRAAADSAQREKRGLWAGSAFECPPAAYRAKRCK